MNYRSNIGEFEEIILLTVGVLYNNAYAVAIKNEIEDQSNRIVNISAIHKSLYRLEKKGMLDSRFGDPEFRRGGKRKRLFFITPLGKKVLDESMELRMKLRDQIPEMAFQWK